MVPALLAKGAAAAAALLLLVGLDVGLDVAHLQAAVLAWIAFAGAVIVAVGQLWRVCGQQWAAIHTTRKAVEQISDDQGEALQARIGAEIARQLREREEEVQHALGAGSPGGPVRVSGGGGVARPHDGAPARHRVGWQDERERGA